MTGRTDAPLANYSWCAINWHAVEAQVKQMQMRIAKAIRRGEHRRAKSLQWLLTHSYYAKLLAVRRVTQNRGCKTPGVDKVVWRTPNQKLRAVDMLNRRGYNPKPLTGLWHF